MTSAKVASAVAARFTALAIAAIALTSAPMAFAQTMGEYGGVTANAATSSGIAAPKLDSSLQSAPSRETGPTQSVQIRDDDSAPPSTDQQTNDNGTHSGRPSDDWTQVK